MCMEYCSKHCVYGVKWSKIEIDDKSEYSFFVVVNPGSLKPYVPDVTSTETEQISI